MSNSLSDTQVQQFHERGFLLGETVLSDEEVEALREDTTRVIERQDEIPAERRPVQIVNLTGKGDAPVWQVVNIWQASDAFRALVEHPRIASDIAQLTGASQVRLWHDQIQYKPAQTGGANMWHQDSPLWAPLQPKDQQVTAWVALDDVDEGNGCMWMAPGSHKWGPQMPFLNTIREFTQVPEFEDRAVPIVACPVKKGQVHYHHALCWHGSNVNASGRPRRAIALHYMTGATTYAKGGAHPMNPFIHVEEGAMIEGERFPLVWPLQ